MKKIWRILLVCSLLAAMLLPVPAGAEGSENPWEYAELEDDTAMITEYRGTETSVVVPEELDGRKVTKIGTRAFAGCGSLESITVPGSVETIGLMAFQGCTSLKTAILRYGVVQIQDGAFTDCSGLESITIPESVTWIGESVFFGCENVTVTVTTPETASELGRNLLKYFDTFGSTETAAEKYCMEHNVPYTFVPNGAEGTAEIAGSQWDYDVLDDSTAVITGYRGTETAVVVPEELDGRKVVSLRYSVFGYGDPVESVTIPDSIQEIKGNPLYHSNVKEIIVSPEHPTLEISDGVLFSRPDSRLVACLPSGRTAYEIPEGIREIGHEAFFGCEQLESVEIPDSVTWIGVAAFENCKALRSVSIPDGVEEISVGMFRRCTALESVEIPDSVTEIGDSAFYGCNSLQTLTIPKTVTKFGMRIFDECPKLTVTVYPDSAAQKNFDKNGIPYVLAEE